MDSEDDPHTLDPDAPTPRFRRFRDHLRDVRAPITGVFEPVPPPQGQPSILAPVFYGHADHLPTGALRTPARVFYPSLDGSPQDAAMLTGVGRYPVVLLLHGMCVHEPEMYRRWDLLPAQLARSGYVVIVPKIANIPPFSDDNPDIAVATGALDWLRTEWTHRAELMPRPMTAVVGHSWGALLGGFVAQRLRAQQSLSAFASLSGGWLESPTIPPPQLALDVATLFTWGTGSSDNFTNLEGANASVLSAVAGSRHVVRFLRGEHWDYFRAGTIACEKGMRGPCTLLRPLAADFVTSFLSRYMPPQHHSALSTSITHTLVPPPLDLTPAQAFYAGGHLQGFAAIAGAQTCSVTHSWRLPPFLEGSMVLGAGS